MIELIQNALLGLVPDWLIAVWAYWPWIATAVATIIAVSLLYRVYRVGGWPGLAVAMTALGTAVGYVLGIRNRPKPVAPPKEEKKTIKKKRPTLADLFK